ncbi:MAG TPA: ATP-binding protein [Candidatus Acidoferrales bacterium]|nr:ATP-binding protein [Candidatus Acidoferrales bacterium]
MIIAADILDFLFVFLPVALLTHLSFRIGLAQGRSRGGTSLFVGSSIVLFSSLFKVYFDVVFGSADALWIFMLTFATSTGLIFAFIGTSRVYFFLLSTRSREKRSVTREIKIAHIGSIIYVIAFVLHLMLLGGSPYIRFGAICYVVNQVMLFGMVFLVAEFFNVAEKPSSSVQAKLTRVLSAYYLLEPLIWLTVVYYTKNFYLPEIPRIFINIIGAAISSVIALIILRFVRQYLPMTLKRIKTTYLDMLRVSVLRDLYIIGSGLTIFIFVILLVAESFYENLRITALKSYAESRFSLTKLTTERMRSALQEIASDLQRTLESNGNRLFLTGIQRDNDYIDVVGSANKKGEITFIRKVKSRAYDSQAVALLKETLVSIHDSAAAFSAVRQYEGGPELFALVKGDDGPTSALCSFAVINIPKILLENAIDTNDFGDRYRLLSRDFRIAYSPFQEEAGLDFQKVILGKKNLNADDLSEKLKALSNSNFSGYEILRGKNNAGVGEYYLLITSPLKFENNEWILAWMEREGRVSRLSQPTNSLLILAGLLVIGLFGGGVVLISVSFRWSLRLEKEVQNKIQELRSSEDRYRRIVENPYIGSFIMVDGRLIYSNGRLADILETGVEQLTGSDLSPFLESRDFKSLKGIFDSIISGEKSGGKWQVEGKTSSGRIISLSGYSSIINIGNKQGVQSLVVDNTIELHEREKLEQFEKLESMATLAAGIAHDFNNILQVVLGSSQLLQHKLGDPDLIRYAENITNVAVRGSDLSKRLLTFSRQKGLEERRIFDVNSIITESLRVFEETFPRTIKIETQLSSEAVYVDGDQSQIQQVIFNLAVNARDAMPHGGTLTLKTEIREVSPTEGEIYQVASGRYVFLMVKDNGEGIPPELMSKVFEPFFTTKEPGKGTGLGLSVVYGIVRSHRGFLKVYSELKRGTVFNIYFPLATLTEKKISPPKQVKESTVPRGERILFVDDEEGIREAAQFLLEQTGYKVVTAKDGMGAIEIYKKEWARINLVVLDLNMPELSGREVFDNLFIINPEVRVLISTGYITPEERAGLKGVVELIEKPFGFDQLIEKVRTALDQTEINQGEL